MIDEKNNIPYFYTIPEQDIYSFSKDFDVTFSFLFHYLTNVMKRTKRLIVYMDNCSGTNKNNYTF